MLDEFKIEHLIKQEFDNKTIEVKIYECIAYEFGTMLENYLKLLLTLE